MAHSTERMGVLGMAEGQMRMSDSAIGRAYIIGDEQDDGRRLPIYSIEAGGSGRLTAGCGVGRAYTIGETGVNRVAEDTSA